MVRRDGPADRADGVWQVVPPPEVEIVQRIASVPDAAPAELAASLTRVVDPLGTTVDWRLTDPLAGAPAFWRWRRRWERRRALGTVRDLNELRELSRTVGHGELGPLDELLASLCVAGDADDATRPGIELDGRAFAAAVDELRDLEVAIEVTGGSGIAVVRAAPAGGGTGSPMVVRSIAPPRSPYVLAATTVASLVVEPAGGLGLRVRTGAGEVRVDGIADVDLTSDPVLVTAADGEVLAVAPRDARPLAWVAPSSPRWSVRRIPLVDVWRAVFDGVPAVAREAGDGTVVATARVPVG